MARLIKRLHTEITIERRSFDLLDDGGPQDVVPSFEDGGHWLFTGRNSITVVTQDSEADFATIAVELWDTEPPPAEGFDETDSSTITLDSGLLEVNPLVEDDAEWLDVGGPGDYNLRAYTTNESYLFQLWPVGP
jgi:hypothetical protein